MSDMIDRAAGAILAEVPEGYGMTDDEARNYARAVIEMMREPTEAMIDAALDELVPSGDFIPAYRAAIEAALEDGVHP